MYFRYFLDNFKVTLLFTYEFYILCHCILWTIILKGNCLTFALLWRKSKWIWEIWSSIQFSANCLLFLCSWYFSAHEVIYSLHLTIRIKFLSLPIFWCSLLCYNWYCCVFYAVVFCFPTTYGKVKLCFNWFSTLYAVILGM